MKSSIYQDIYFLWKLRVAKCHSQAASPFTPTSAMWLYNRLYSWVELALSVQWILDRKWEAVVLGKTGTLKPLHLRALSGTQSYSL